MVQLGPLMFVCTSCGKDFLSKTKANSHVRLHCTGKPHVCSACGKTFLDIRNLKKHQLRHIPLSERPKCAECGAQFIIKRCLLRHIDGSFQHRRCTICGAVHRMCRALGRLSDSVNPAVTAVEHPTPNCPTKEEQTQSEIYQPRSDSTSSENDQRICSQVTAASCPSSNHFSTPLHTMKKHTLRHNRVLIHRCPDCGKILQSRGNLMRHFRQHTGERPYTCLDCGRTFVDQGNMRKHTRVHKRPVQVQLDTIDLSEFQLDGSGAVMESLKTESSSALLTSIASNLVDTKMEISDASPSQLATKVQESALSSKRCKSTRNSFICFVCNKMFPYKSHLEGHMRTHLDQRPYQCEVCGKAFKRPCDLLIHSRFHDEQKQFECIVCGKRFRWKNGLDRHMRVHTRERPFLCNQCGRSFSDWGSHKKHMRRHSGIPASFPAERNLCKLCNKSFAWKRGLVRHTRQAHCWDAGSWSTQ